MTLRERERDLGPKSTTIILSIASTNFWELQWMRESLGGWPERREERIKDDLGLERERERGWDVAGGVRFLPRRPIASRSTYPFSGFWSWRLRCLVGNMDRRKQWATQHLPLVCVVKLRLVVLAVVSFLTIHRHQPPSR